MKLQEIDFEENLMRDSYFITDGGYTKEELSLLIEETDKIINDNNKTSRKKAEAYVWKFQLLLYKKILAPKLLEKALELCPDMPEALLRKGLYYYKKNNDVNKMLEFTNKVIDQSPDYATAWLFRATTINRHFKKDKLKMKQAFTDCEKFIQLKPKCIYGYEDYGFILKMSLNDRTKVTKENIKEIIDKAIFYYSEALKLDPSAYNNYDSRAELYLMREEHFGNEQDHKNALSDILNYFKYLQQENPGVIYDTNFKNIFHDKIPSKCEKYYIEIMNEVSKDNNLYWFAFNSLAESLSQQGYYKKAIETYTKMIKEAPCGSIFQLIAFNGRASVYRDMKKYDKALADYNIMLKRSPYISEDDCPEKENWDYVPLDITHEYIYWQRALIYGNYMTDYDNEKKDKNNKKKAIIEYSKAIDVANRHSLNHYYSERANQYKELGELNMAIDDYTTAIAISERENDISDLSLNYQYRMELYLQKGEKEKAFEDYIKILEIEDTPRKNKYKEVDKYEELYE